MKSKKKSKAKAPKKKSLFGGAAKSLKKLGKGSGLRKLTTTQKVVGGTALVALGLGYLATRRAGSASSETATTDIDPNTGESLLSTEGASI
ncbi:hypothetical protein FY528_11290 [Hymenobacter lutimineralis]|uniref:Uncharacterized protein n=1 Tax=Hymenobacter lutimineralis TaxID=2606448 RepID=A0A5D6UZR1_9BACT|nr:MULTISPECIES: hypothetical protein [Hymenobacter]QIX61774.1 hypothetical protein HER32_11530 [Hymenobacter sp. BT18]TYZ09321.1 hypothetical protein FY528_11290 [Hymenobacter lutimineralis]